MGKTKSSKVKEKCLHCFTNVNMCDTCNFCMEKYCRECNRYGFIGKTTTWNEYIDYRRAYFKYATCDIPFICAFCYMDNFTRENELYMEDICDIMPNTDVDSDS